MRAAAAARASVSRPRSRPASAARRGAGAKVLTSASVPALAAATPDGEATQNSARVGSTGGFPDVDSLSNALSGYSPEEQERRLRDRGSLTVLASCPSAPGWTMPGRNAARTRPSTAPGPGDYNLGIAQRGQGQRGVSWGKPPGSGSSSGSQAAARLATKCVTSPGPTYDTRNARSVSIRGGTVGKSLRALAVLEELRPGPGEYSLASTLSQAGVGIGQPRVRPSSAPPRLQVLFPPPRPSSASSQPKWSIGNSVRPPINGRSEEDNSCGELYAFPTTLSAHPAASCRAGSQPPELGRWEMRPDPATYSARNPFSTIAVGFTRAARPSSAPPVGRQQEQEPVGPGSYTPHSGPSVTGTPLIRSRSAGALKDPRRQWRIPGPSEYDVGTARDRSTQQVGPRPSFSIGQAKRPPAGSGASAAPGPGKYGLPPDRCTTTCRPTRGPRLPARRRAGPPVGGGRCEARIAARRAPHGPGPGSHSPPIPRGPRRAATFGTGPCRPSPPPAGCAPGPDYGPPSEFTDDVCKGVRRGISMAKGERTADLELKKQIGLPGPGAYKAYSSFS